MAERRCENCRFWAFMREVELHVEGGQCRRHAPKPIRRAEVLGHRDFIDQRGTWPWTMFDDWCGEHMPKIKGGE